MPEQITPSYKISEAGYTTEIREAIRKEVYAALRALSRYDPEEGK